MTMITDSHRQPTPALASRPWRDRSAHRVRLFATALARRLPHFRGKTRVLRACDRYLRRVAVADRLHLTVDGVAFALDTEDLIDFRLAYLAEHDSSVARCLTAMIGERAAVLWDVGANVGAISLPLARRHAGLVVDAFEPSPAVATRLRRNLALNPLLSARVRVHGVALCDRSGWVDFFPSAEPENSGVGTLMAAANTATTPVRVVAHSGDDLIASGAARPPDVIKIDVEGFEYDVLTGLRRHLAQRRDVAIVFEHEPYRLRDRAHAGSACELLAGLGFDLFGLPRHPAAIVPLQPSMLERHVDILACRPAATSAMREAWS